MIFQKNDTVDDMILHIPDHAYKNSLRKSIVMWEHGTSSKAAISCKETFSSEPDHSEFISEIDNGKQVIRCSGWRQPMQMSFMVPPPFLVFDISIVFRNQIKTLDVLPLEICVYNEKYKLGGITSYVEDRRHYVGYVVKENSFLFYDGLPSAKPVLRRHVGQSLDGDISLLIYFPCDQVDMPASNLKEVTTEENEQVNKVKSTSICQQKKRSFGLRKNPKKKRFSTKSWLSGSVDEVLSEDFLLAQAVEKIENEIENEYERPKGKNYRSFRKSSSSDVVHEKKKENPFPELDAYLRSLSSSSVSENENEECEPEINTELIDFISTRKEFILKLISDPDCKSEYHVRSERLVTLHHCKSLRTFEANALKELTIICNQMKKYIGCGFAPCEPYTSHIFSNILTEEKKRDHNDMFDFGGKFIIPIKMRKFDSIHKTIDYVIIPEIFTEYIMEKQGLEYRDASQYLYCKSLPTSHHLDMLIDDKNVMFSTKVKTDGQNIIVQVVKNNIAFERSHVIVNSANTHLMHNGTIALAIVQHGGLLIQNESDVYITKNGPLHIGDVIPASPGNLHCLHLFHSVPPRWEVDKAEEDLIQKIVCETIFLADNYGCKSISIPVFSCRKHTSGTASVKKSVESILLAILENTTKLEHLNIIRIVDIDTGTLHQLIKTIESLLKPSLLDERV